MSNRPIAFLHIPKTAGSSLRRLLQSQANVAWYQTNKHPTLEDIKNAECDVFGGHMHLDKVLQCNPSKIFTILRDPVERIVSEIRYIQRQEKHVMHKKLRDEKVEDIIAEDHPMSAFMSNRICKCLSSKSAEIALRKLRHNNIHVALLEHYDDFVQAICDEVDIVRPASEKTFNQAPTKTSQDPAFDNPEIVKRLKALTIEDRRLYSEITIQSKHSEDKVFIPMFRRKALSRVKI